MWESTHLFVVPISQLIVPTDLHMIDNNVCMDMVDNVTVAQIVSRLKTLKLHCTSV